MKHKPFALINICGLAIGISATLTIALYSFYVINYLENFSYHITIPWQAYISTFPMLMAIILLTVSYQSIRTARSNPIRFLRSE